MDFAPLLADGNTAANLSMFDPVSPPAASIRDLTVLVLAVTGAIFLIVEGILIYSIVRFRRRRSDETGEPPQVYGSQPIEIAWTAAPALIVFVIMLVVARTLGEVNANPSDPQPGAKPLYITVVGRQWWWEFTYDRYDGQELGRNAPLVTANELHFPVSADGVTRPVFLTLKSADVCHSFWVPRLAGKTDLIPGRTNQMWFRASEPGLYLGQCAEYCGTQHANMLLSVYADSPDDFARWLANEESPAARNPAGTAGREVFLSQSCVNCHRVRGTPAAGTYGPDLTHLMSRKTIAGGMLPNTRDRLSDWIDNPQTKENKQGCLMPAFNLSQHDRDAIVDYLVTLR
jgi:cytochrome c oxidase subunit 2